MKKRETKLSVQVVVKRSLEWIATGVSPIGSLGAAGAHMLKDDKALMKVAAILIKKGIKNPLQPRYEFFVGSGPIWYSTPVNLHFFTIAWIRKCDLKKPSTLDNEYALFIFQGTAYRIPPTTAKLKWWQKAWKAFLYWRGLK